MKKISLFSLVLIVGFSLVIGLNLIFSFNWVTAWNLFVCLAVILAPAGVFLFVGRLLPKKLFDGEKWWFRVGKFQRIVCVVTKVKSWKDKIPVGGRVAGFRLNKLNTPRSLEYVNRFIQESCFAEWLHFTCFVWCFVALIFLPSELFLNMSLPISLLFAYANITPTIIQWYTRPRMIKLRDSLLKRQDAYDKEGAEQGEYV